MRQAAQREPRQTEAIPSGSALLDSILGCGGWPRGRLVEVYGGPDSGKTTLALHAAAMAQRGGGYAAFIDADCALNPVFARRIGVNPEALLVARPSCAEHALDMCQTLTACGALDMVILDSVAALAPIAELEGPMGVSHALDFAAGFANALRTLHAAAARTNTLVMFINQVRMAPDGERGAAVEKTPGGRALRGYAAVLADVRRLGLVAGADGPAGTRIQVRIVKNTLAPAFGQAQLDILFDRGLRPD